MSCTRNYVLGRGWGVLRGEVGGVIRERDDCQKERDKGCYQKKRRWRCYQGEEVEVLSGGGGGGVIRGRGRGCHQGKGWLAEGEGVIVIRGGGGVIRGRGRSCYSGRDCCQEVKAVMRGEG